jgi:hypothetical protein
MEISMSDATRFEVFHGAPADVTLSTAMIEATPPEYDGLGAARGILSGIVLVLPFWALVAYLFWYADVM